MYCKHCGKEYLTDKAVICIKCQAPRGKGENFCHYCGQPINPGQKICMNCGVALDIIPAGTVQKSKLAAGLLALFLGTIGIHNFYLGYIGRGIAHILLVVLPIIFMVLSMIFVPNDILGGISILFMYIGIFASKIWALIEMILIFVGTTKVDANGIALK